MVFITAGMGGGTGTGAAPVIARAAREHNILTVGVVTKPFQFEGAHRMKTAEAGIQELQQYVDTLIVIPNQNLFRIANEKTTFADAFKMADEVLHSGVRGVTDLIVMPGLINLDFADIRTVMSEMGKAMMGTGEAEGARRAIDAAEAAISNPLLDEVSLKGARAMLININRWFGHRAIRSRRSRESRSRRSRPRRQSDFRFDLRPNDGRSFAGFSGRNRDRRRSGDWSHTKVYRRVGFATFQRQTTLEVIRGGVESAPIRPVSPYALSAVAPPQSPSTLPEDTPQSQLADEPKTAQFEPETEALADPLSPLAPTPIEVPPTLEGRLEVERVLSTIAVSNEAGRIPVSQTATPTFPTLSANPNYQMRQRFTPEPEPKRALLCSSA